MPDRRRLRSIAQITERSQQVLPVRLDTPSPLSQLASADRDPAVGVAGEQFSHKRRLVRHDLIAGFGMIVLRTYR